MQTKLSKTAYLPSSPDDLPGGTFTSECAAHEMQSQFRGWDPRSVSTSPEQKSGFDTVLYTLRLTAIISRVKTVLKWKICHMKELDKWFEVVHHFACVR